MYIHTVEVYLAAEGHYDLAPPLYSTAGLKPEQQLFKTVSEAIVQLAGTSTGPT